MFKKVKKLSAVVLTLGLVGGFFLPNDSVSAKSWDCEITIDANKHSENKGNYAYAKGDCWLDVYGYFSEVNNKFIIEPSGFGVHDGQVIELDFDNVVKVNTIQKSTTKPDPKPEKPSKPQPKPDPKPDPKPEPKPEVKPDPKPEKPSKPQPKPDSKPNANTGDTGAKPSNSSNGTGTTPSKPENKPANNVGSSTDNGGNNSAGTKVEDLKVDEKENVNVAQGSKTDKVNGKKEEDKDSAVAKASGNNDQKKDSGVSKKESAEKTENNVEEAKDSKEVKEQVEGEKLPDTATNMYNFALIGGALLLVGGSLFFVRKRKVKNEA